jgi:DNA-directed RNA polymerase subunit RPC12/RpoP
MIQKNMYSYNIIMVNYTCSRCKRLFTKKQNYEVHINRKHKCDIVADLEMIKQTAHKITKLAHNEVELAQNDTNLAQTCNDPIAPLKVRKEHICMNCGSKFSRATSLTRHKKGYCKSAGISTIDNVKTPDILKRMTDLETANELLKKELTEIKSQKTGNTINNTNIENQTNNTINVMAFGSNNWESFVTEEDCKRILKTGFKAVPNLVEHTHLNVDFPALQNCYITNLRGKHAMMHDGKSWKLVEMADIIEKLREDKQDYLALKFDEYRKSLDDVTIKRFGKFLVEKDSVTQKCYNLL